jgi:hypothetical protein
VLIRVASNKKLRVDSEFNTNTMPKTEKGFVGPHKKMIIAAARRREVIHAMFRQAFYL